MAADVWMYGPEDENGWPKTVQLYQGGLHDGTMECRTYRPERMCHLVKVGPLIVKGTGYLLSCRHMAHGSEPVYCPVCGAKVVQE